MPPFSSDSQLYSLLSKLDAVTLLELIHESLSCNSKENLAELVERLKSLIPFDYGLCGLAKIDKNGMKPDFDITNGSYPNEWLEVYLANEYFKIDPVPKENFTHFNIQFWDDSYKKYDTPKKFVSEARDFGLLKGYTYGVKNLSSTQGSLLSLAGPNLDRDERTEAIIKLVTPHIHQCYVRVIQETGKKSVSPLSEREKEVLNWVGQGKSSWDISVILGISERTVKFHVDNIKIKLNAVSRSHAVAIALDLGLISL